MRAPSIVVAAVVALAAAASLALAGSARAGGGPETTLVVVNADSPVSRRVANLWVTARRIPATHVVEVGGVPHVKVIDVETFRTRLWAPVKAFLVEHHLEDRIDLIAWSADFPYGVDFAADEPNPPDKRVTGIASLTAMTYFARAVEAKNAAKYLSLDANRYYRRGAGEVETRPPTDAERAAFGEAEDALKKKDYATAAEAFGRGVATYGENNEVLYNYACCLARIGKLDEALAILARAAEKGFRQPGIAKNDEDLTPLRARPEFEKILAKMAEDPSDQVQPAIGFRSRVEWTGADDPVEAGAADSLDRYYLSTSLAYTGEWGNDVPEATAALSASIASDGKNPEGTFYFLVNGDVRAQTRKGRFDGAVAALRARGRKAEILEKDATGQTGVLPVCKTDVLGAMVGISDFDWGACKSRILAGAIVEHLTSFGALFGGAGQTKCTAFVRAGAAGTSGTVNEPYALESKFPVPSIHVHYVDGCSLAEAFYESVWGPYQLLVIGDGLARPFAKFAKVEVATEGWTGTGTVNVRALVEPAAGRPIGAVELFVDGAYVTAGKPGEDLPLDTTKLDDGPHDVRVVAVESDRVGTRSFGAAVLATRNGTRKVTIDGEAKGPRPAVAYEGPVTLSGVATESSEVVVYAGARELARAPASGGSWKVSVPAARLGVGTTVLHARAGGSSGLGSRSSFVLVKVEPPATRKGVKAAGAKRGFVATVTPQAGKPVEVALANLGGAPFPNAVRDAIAAKVKGAVKSVVVEGEFDVAEAGAYEFLMNARGRLALDVDGKPALAEGKAALDHQAYAYVGLAAGRHALKLTLAPEGAPELSVLLGGDRVTAPLESK